MRRCIVPAALCLSLMAPGVGPSQAMEALAPGAYDVLVHLEESFTEDKPDHHMVCLTDARSKPAQGLFIMTPDTPISHCPVRNVHETAQQITFDIICEGEGPNAGHAEASYDIEGDSFQGRIAMLMGGKNMRMDEVQEGHRIGDCKDR